jgi:hypothetical protein
MMAGRYLQRSTVTHCRSSTGGTAQPKAASTPRGVDRGSDPHKPSGDTGLVLGLSIDVGGADADIIPDDLDER